MRNIGPQGWSTLLTITMVFHLPLDLTSHLTVVKTVLLLYHIYFRRRGSRGFNSSTHQREGPQRLLGIHSPTHWPTLSYSHIRNNLATWRANHSLCAPSSDTYRSTPSRGPSASHSVKSLMASSMVVWNCHATHSIAIYTFARLSRARKFPH